MIILHRETVYFRPIRMATLKKKKNIYIYIYILQKVLARM